MNIMREKLGKVLGEKYPYQEHYVYLEDKDTIYIAKDLTIHQLNNIVSSSSYLDKFYDNVYINIGDWDPNKHFMNNIHPDDIEAICSKNKKGVIKNKHLFVSGFIISRIMLYELLINAYTMNYESFKNYFSNFFIPKKIIINFFSNLEFFLTTNPSILYIIKNIINKDSIMDIIMFKTGYPRFSPNDLEKIFDMQKIKINVAYKICENVIDKDDMLNYIEVCLKGLENIFGDNDKQIIMIRRGKGKNLLYRLLSKTYNYEQSLKVRKIINHYINLGGKKEIDIDEYFSKAESDIFYSNRMTYLGY